VGVGKGVAEGLSVEVRVGEGSGVAVDVADGTTVGVFEGAVIGEGESVAPGRGETACPRLQAERSSAKVKRKIDVLLQSEQANSTSPN